MALNQGSRVGSYEIVSPLGAGGMGEVYRARDARLNRDVALKVLPGAFADDPERLARFEREAQVLAALNHPHIATIHGIEEKDGARALVLELVEGETLAEVIARGPLPPDQAVAIARQIADALEAAHEHGIIHRDLKPANVKVTPEGAVKVLDFGLAKLAGPPEGGPYIGPPGGTYASGSERAGSPSAGAGFSRPDLTTSPTMATPAMLTGATVLMGTAGYMSPEQARGKPIDKRADIWAFGVVLFEMLSGKRVFEGETVTEVAGAVIHKEPDWGALPPVTSPVIAMVVRRCLQKNARQRFRDMGDVRLALDGAFTVESAGPASPLPLPRTGRRSIALGAAAAIGLALATGIAVWAVAGREAPAERGAIRFDVGAAAPRTLSPLIDISPDGRTLSFVALDNTSTPRLWVRSLESGEARVLAPTEQTRQPTFWSPDSRYLAFYVDGKIRKVAVAGGPAETVAETKVFSGGSWSRAGEIIFSTTEGIMRVPAAGGTQVAVATIDKSRKESAQLLPWFLPDGRHFLYLRIFSGTDSQTGIYVGSIDATPAEQSSTRLIAAGQQAVYSPSSPSGRGQVLFLRDGLLMAQAFDEDSLSLVGDAMPVTGDRVQTNNVLASLSASTNGTVIYQKGSGEPNTLTMIDRGGKTAPLFPGDQLERPMYPRVSPEGRRLAVVVGGALWLYDLEGRPPIRLTFGDEGVYSPLWTRDGRRIVYERGGDSATTLFTVPADGSGAMPEAAAPEGHFHPHGWSADGEIVAGRLTNNSGDVVRFAPQPGSKVQEIVATPQSEGFGGSVSPDGRWLAYTTDSTGRMEIWVRPVSASGAAVRVSPNGGSEPTWSRDGKELFYLGDRKLMSVPVTLGNEFSFKAPVELFTSTVIRGQQPPSYDVTPDGRFVMMTVADAADVPITVIVNWTALMRDAAATH